MFKLFGSKKHPKGPDWSKAKEHCLDLSGTRIYFTLPPHSDTTTSFKPQADKYNIYDDSIFWKDDKSNLSAAYMNGGFKSGWEYKTLPFLKPIGRLDLGIGIIKATTPVPLTNIENFINFINHDFKWLHWSSSVNFIFSFCLTAKSAKSLLFNFWMLSVP